MNTKVRATGDVGSQIASSGRLPEPPEKRSPVRVSHWLPLPFVVAVVLCTGLTSSAHAQATNPQQKLESLLRLYPDADTNKDGNLTVEKAKAHMDANSAANQKAKLRKNRNADEAKEGGSAELLALYEAREFKGVKYPTRYKAISARSF